MAVVVCEEGWFKDPFHTAAGSPCVLTAGWLHAIMGAGAVGFGLTALSFSTTIAMLRHSGEPWSSARMCAYSGFLVFLILWSAVATLILANPAGELTEPSALVAWRWLHVIGLFIMCNMLGLYVFSVLLLPAIQFVSGLDAVRYRQLEWLAKRGVSTTLLSYNCISVVGTSVALFGAAASLQDVGAVLGFGGAAVGTVCISVTLLHMASTLQEVHTGLNSASASAKQVGNLRQFLRFQAAILGGLSLQCIVVVLWGTLRALCGAILYGSFGFLCCVFSVGFLRFEYRRLRPTRPVRSHSMRVTPARSSAADGTMSPRFGHHTIAGFVAATANDFSQGAAGTSAAITANGVSLQLMRDFADEHGVGDSTTASEVCARHVKVATAQAQTALVRILQDGRDGTGARWCGKPTSFISYAWSYPFRLLIDIVERFEAENPPPSGQTHYYFLDQFSLNQHKFVDEGANQKELQNMVVQALQAEMQHSGHVLMCMHPWNQPVPLRRMWCLFELFTAMNTGVDLTMCFGEDDAAALCAAISNGYFDAKDAVGEIDAANAGASVASDKEMIMGLIEEQVGLDRFNAEMREYLLKAFKTTVTGVLARQHGRGGGSGEQRHGVRPRVHLGVAATQEGALGLSEQMGSLSQQMDSLASRMSSLEEQIAALMCMMRGSTTL